MLLTDAGPVLGLDPRGLPEIEAEWIAKSRRGAERAASRAAQAIRATVVNERLLRRKVERDDPILAPQGEDVALDEVAAPPAESPSTDEVLRLSGIPDGHGAVSCLAEGVSGVTRAWGQEAEALCAGVSTWLVRSPRKHKKNRKGRRP